MDYKEKAREDNYFTNVIRNVLESEIKNQYSKKYYHQRKLKKLEVTTKAPEVPSTKKKKSQQTIIEFKKVIVDFD